MPPTAPTQPITAPIAEALGRVALEQTLHIAEALGLCIHSDNSGRIRADRITCHHCGGDLIKGLRQIFAIDRIRHAVHDLLGLSLHDIKEKVTGICNQAGLVWNDLDESTRHNILAVAVATVVPNNSPLADQIKERYSVDHNQFAPALPTPEAAPAPVLPPPTEQTQTPPSDPVARPQPVQFDNDKNEQLIKEVFGPASAAEVPAGVNPETGGPLPSDPVAPPFRRQIVEALFSEASSPSSPAPTAENDTPAPVPVDPSNGTAEQPEAPAAPATPAAPAK